MPTEPQAPRGCPTDPSPTGCQQWGFTQPWPCPCPPPPASLLPAGSRSGHQCLSTYVPLSETPSVLRSQNSRAEPCLRGGVEQVHGFPAAGHSPLPTGTPNSASSPTNHLTSNPKAVLALYKVSLSRFGRKKRPSPLRCFGWGDVRFFPALQVGRGGCGRDNISVPTLGSRRGRGLRSPTPTLALKAQPS